MHRTATRALVAAAMMTALGSASAFAQHSSTITYQGALQHQGEPYTGDADFYFGIWTSESGGAEPLTHILKDGVTVDDGLFTAPLDFGAWPFTGDRWLEIRVRTPAWDGQGAEPAFTALPGRQRLSASPYSVQTRGIFVNELGDRVGIGTTDPAAPLHVAPAEGILIGSPNSGASALQMGLSQPFNGFARIQAVKAGGTAWGDLALNSSGGRVGVGTIAPQSMLHVAGEVRADGGVRFPGGAITNVLTLTGPGDLGPMPGGAQSWFSIPVAGAAIGDVALATLNPLPPELAITSIRVESAGRVFIRVRNISNMTFDAPPMTIKIIVFKQ